MDPKKRKIYIILIVVTILLSVGILVWSNLSGGSSPEADLITPVTNSGRDNDATGSFQAPPVFPASKTFDSGVLQNPEYTQLRGYTPLDIANQLGRPDPFNRY
ncbi:MAG: hypothetical protein A3I07_01300 [Candidatus Doudnabacteria bacterium RIFCSPLOWO2_02_FULL_42_9]|uniref:Uncharacterized protein n=1 Tax=Candidatus Doudnabacteria bacterium RIFCSPHIGHO2_01_FULL_41_86 TaxID=1817821 RepID=A0A1F5N8T1_9BACT|nr:MAG: hypothetical protein A2717_00860 [Candidatus Doudnabacteria bacterium RIFCSPHIGHO2_01_FULL_41_86]OGE75393.1 MAG: hypothetical protein A3K07_01375 [Candidatus Doudnabacteria bacterium RIFCSPHIGHO2_01_43_10]OGE86581.1 MAG: hypothetical protein A3E28_04195 [Candidatus Doudnabacteria bacterium RIFCSPHIGHO2_12_FULL_42_22]OGE87481.1 MAG: hypothetical protein A3C49_03855 [Candidatus Doudnabacteria bacterium RIFCSPHIGHO2_02_FULL_42_25]OGE92784.1 MAG: hypothetical protein A2895_04660 [Candidatus